MTGVIRVLSILIGLFSIRVAAAESQDVPAYPLPDALVLQNGQRVKDQKTWAKQRRPEILQLFAENVYGKTPKERLQTSFQVDSVDQAAFGGKAIRKQITIRFDSKQRPSPEIHVLYYLPAHAPRPVPTIVGLGFSGNQTVSADPGIALPEVWMIDPAERIESGRPVLNKERRQQRKMRAIESSRGQSAAQWQVEKIVDHGFGLATAYYGDIEPDFDGGMRYGVRNLFLKPGQTSVAPDEWGALGAWAWGLSRIVDYLETDRDADAKRIAIFGHSRLGKAAMWAAAQDTRFALILSNESGVGGASLYRTQTGETIEHLNTAFPHWFCENFHRYTGHPDQVPVDGNLLLSLMAPRPLYVASAELDKSSNPAAEFFSAVQAGRVYQLFGKPGLGTDVKPPLEIPIMDRIGYHERRGKHDVTAYDWDQYLKFLEMHFAPQKGVSK